jgi:DNA mismatch repair ATPase MutS
VKAFLMYRDRDFGEKDTLPRNAEDLVQDLGLSTLFEAMSSGDPFLFQVAQNAVLSSLHKPDTILYRQAILADCLANPHIVRAIYETAVEAITREKKVWGWFSEKYVEGTLHRAVEVLEIFFEILKKLRRTADEQAANFRSEGFRRFFAMLSKELDNTYLARIEDHLRRLPFRSGVLLSAGLGTGNKGVNYVLHKVPEVRQNWLERIQIWLDQAIARTGRNYFYEVHERDEAGYRALSELRAQGISQVASALARSTDHILSFFQMLRLELGFYIGCLNLRNQMLLHGGPICLPVPLPQEDEAVLSCHGLFDVCLELSMGKRVVGNDISADGKSLIMITGANRGGKSTLLRSLGLAHLMMQCGMFVPAAFFRANVCNSIFTHFKREEDTSMKSGKLDEELARMSSIVDEITPHSIALLNESFASTNEREGSEIARQIVRALLENQIKVFYVTHMFDLADGFYREKMEQALFLRAERLADGKRTFRLPEAAPLPTSYGHDLYQRIFGNGHNTERATSGVQL